MGAVGYIYFCGSDSGRLQRAGASFGPAFRWALGPMGLDFSRDVGCSSGGEFVGQSMDISTLAEELPECQ